MPKNKVKKVDLTISHKPSYISDRFAKYICKILRWTADTFFQKRYGHRAVVLETVAGVPGMIAGMLIHFKCLRSQRDDKGWIKTLLDEAENERMHLMTFIEIAKPNWLERTLILIAQFLFSIYFFFLYIITPKTAHRMIGYFEEEAIISYTLYLEEIDNGKVENLPAPKIAIDYWKLPQDAKLREVIIAVRNDEASHRDVNHEFADQL